LPFGAAHFLATLPKLGHADAVLGTGLAGRTGPLCVTLGHDRAAPFGVTILPFPTGSGVIAGVGVIGVGKLETAVHGKRSVDHLFIDRLVFARGQSEKREENTGQWP